MRTTLGLLVTTWMTACGPADGSTSGTTTTTTTSTTDPTTSNSPTSSANTTDSTSSTTSSSTDTSTSGPTTTESSSDDTAAITGSSTTDTTAGPCDPAACDALCATMPDNICGAPQLGQCSDDDKCECFPDGVDCTTGVETGGGNGLGDACDQDRDCATSLCWDFNAHDPMCGGKYCSAPCSSDQECIDLAEAAGAPTPNDALCGADDQCNLVTTGLPRGLFCS